MIDEAVSEWLSDDEPGDDVAALARAQAYEIEADQVEREARIAQSNGQHDRARMLRKIEEGCRNVAWNWRRYAMDWRAQ